MPWKSSQAMSHTHMADTPHLQRMWSQIANQVLRETGDDSRAIMEANAVVRKAKAKASGKAKGDAKGDAKGGK